MADERKMFKFYRSYYDVAIELPDKDRLAFYDAIMNRQFFGIEPNLKGLAKLVYISQKHSIDAQVKGWEDYFKLQLSDNHAMIPPIIPPIIQLKEKEKEKEEDKRDATKVATQSRILSFKESLYPFTKSKGGKYDNDMVKDFFNYWSELNKSGTKMRWELQQTFEIPKRLTTWEKRDNTQFKSKTNGKDEQNHVY